MKITIFDRNSELEKVTLGVFFEDDGVVKFTPDGDDKPLSSTEFDDTWGDSYIHRTTNKTISKTEPKKYLEGLLIRFGGRVWAEKTE